MRILRQVSLIFLICLLCEGIASLLPFPFPGSVLSMIVLFLLAPSLASSVGVLVPVGALVAIGVSRLLYNKGKL